MKWTRKNFLAALTSSLTIPLFGFSKEEKLVPPKVTLPFNDKSRSVDLSLLLRCIAVVETGTKLHPDGDDSVIGPKGERSRYQITFQVWKQHIPFPKSWSDDDHLYEFNRYCHGPSAKWISRRHLLWLDSSLPRTTPIERNAREYALAWCWHGGLSSWTLPVIQVPYTTRKRCNDYATRVSNLYADLKHKVL